VRCSFVCDSGFEVEAGGNVAKCPGHNKGHIEGYVL